MSRSCRCRWRMPFAVALTIGTGAALSLLAAMPSGCSSDCEPGDPCTQAPADAAAEQQPDVLSEPEPIDADVTPWKDFCAASWGMQVGIYEPCCTEADKQTGGYQFLLGIAQSFASRCETMLTVSAQRGRITLQSELAAQCGQAFQATYGAIGCQMIWTGVDWEASGCRGAVQGNQGVGEACSYRYECQDGLFCYGYSIIQDGTCGAPSGGGACRAEEASFETDDLIDSMLGTHPACEAGQICFLTAKTIGVCSQPVAAGVPCVFDQECQAGLRCHMGQCGADGPGPEGAACRSVTDCVQRLYCAPAEGGANGTCSKRKSADQPCSTLYDECLGYCLSPDGGTDGSCADFCGSG